MAIGTSGIFLEATTRDARCNECHKPFAFGFIVCRYRGTQAACRNIFYHKECLLDCLSDKTLALPKSTLVLPKPSKAKCLICQQGKTDFKFICTETWGGGKNYIGGKPSNYNYGGYHKACVESFVNEWAGDFAKYNEQLKNAVKAKEIMAQIKLDRTEHERVLNKAW